MRCQEVNTVIWVVGFWLSILVGFAEPAHARKFDFKSESFATYLRGTYGTSMVSDSPYADSSGSGVTVDKKIATNSSGEFGLLFSGQHIALRLGGELLMPRKLSDIKGTDAGGVEQFNLVSDMMALVAIGNIEVFPYRTPTSRAILGAGYGMAFVTLDNTYTMTADGTANFGLSDFTEAANARVPLAQLYVGYEILFTDTVTAVFDLGYRYALVNEFKSTKEVTTFTGAQVESTTLVNHGGNNRSTNLSGPFAGLALRFYVGL